MKAYVLLLFAVPFIVGCNGKPENPIVNPIVYDGNNLVSWEVILGDGILTMPGETPVSSDDIETVHFPIYSELHANIHNCKVQAHNITFLRKTDISALLCSHQTGYMFRIPFTISKSNPDFNGQTVEGGFFIWDGSGTRKDYGLAFQWMLNPWIPGNFGELRAWTGNAWRTLDTIPPDTLWHSVAFSLDYTDGKAELVFDGVTYTDVLTQTDKPSDWGTETAARLQCEIISIDPENLSVVPAHKAQFKNWRWKWKNE
jgi:hypothetical protein